jgi:hypothetical protein
VEREVAVLLEGSMVVTSCVQPTDVVVDVARRAVVARADLVFLRVEVLLAPLAHGNVLAQLEAAVDAV